MLRYTTDRSPGLVALYDIRPGNGAGQFLQPRNLHGVSEPMNMGVNDIKYSDAKFNHFKAKE